MVHANEVSEQLKRLKVNFQFWCRAEIRELPKILFEGEQLEHVLIGRYEGGFALFCATDRRVLLIDKKPFYLTIEDIRYDMISDVQYNHRMIDATVRLGTIHKTIAFTGYNHTKMRDFTHYIQQQVMVYRQQQNETAQAQPQSYATSFAPEPTAPSLPVNNNVDTVPLNPIEQTQPVLPAPSSIAQPQTELPSVPLVAAPTAATMNTTLPSAPVVLAELSQKQRRPILNPYTKMPLIVRRRVSRFY